MRPRALVAMALALLWQAIPADADIPTLRVVGAMVEGPEGTPLATATGVAGGQGGQVYVTSTAVIGVEGLCLRTWAQGACHPVRPQSVTPVNGLPGMVTVAIPFDQDEMMRKFSNPALNIQLEIGLFEPGLDAPEVALMTQNGFGGWEIPLDPAIVVGQLAAGFTVRSSVLSARSVGAPVSHAEKGLIGVITAVDPSAGMARVTGFAALTDSLVASGIDVPPEMRPQVRLASELPRAVENEMGRMYVFQDASTIPQGLWGFYGPSKGTGFSDTFVTEVSYSVYGVDLSAPRGQLIAGGGKTVPLVLTGMSLEAPFRGTPPDHVATCIVHATPSSGGRRALIMQFWRAVPSRFDSTTGNKSYDEAAPLLTGWSDGASPCLDRLAALDPNRVAAFSGQVPASSAPATGTGHQIGTAPSAQSPPVQEEPWRWTPMEAADKPTISGHNGASRANLTCYRQNDRIVAGIALSGQILDPIRSLDLSSGELVFRLRGGEIATKVVRVADRIAVEAPPDGAAFTRALGGTRTIDIRWRSAAGDLSLGKVRFDGGETILQGLLDSCEQGEIVIGLSPSEAANPMPPSAPVIGDGWAQLPRWDGTGRPAVVLPIVGDRRLFLGCTESAELVVAIDPGLGISQITIAGRESYETGRHDKTTFAYFDRAMLNDVGAGAVIGFRAIGAPFEHPGPANLAINPAFAGC